MHKIVLFDLDGTLLDTSEGVIDSVKYTVETLGLEKLEEKELLKFIGPPIFNSLQNRYNLTDNEASVATNIFRNAYKDKFLFEARIYDNVFETLMELKKQGVKIGVATYKREDYAISLLKHYRIIDYCDVVHGADFGNKLSKSDIMVLCMNELGAKGPKDVVLVGDTNHDAMGALNLGTDFIGVTFGFGFKSKDDVNEFPNIGTADSFSDILKCV